MTVVRVIAGSIVGFLTAVLGQTGIVVAWWVRGSFPTELPLGLLVVVPLALVGWLAGRGALLVSGGNRAGVYAAVALTALVLVGNVVLGIALEPLWFKALVATVLIPLMLVGSQGQRPDPVPGSRHDD